MGNLYENERAETEANEVAYRFVNSRDVIGDMGRAYGTSFSNIRMHDDAASHSKVRAAGKDAIASGKDIYFGEGILNDHSEMGNMLVGHELAHTMQQAGGFGMSESVEMGAEQGGILKSIKRFLLKAHILDKKKMSYEELRDLTGSSDVTDVEPLKKRLDKSQDANLGEMRYIGRDEAATGEHGLHKKVLAESNAQYRRGGKRDVNAGLAGLGFRDNMSDQGRQDYLVRSFVNTGLGKVFEDSIDGYLTANPNGPDTEGLEKVSLVEQEKNSFFMNDSTEGLTHQLLDITHQRMMSDAGIEYLDSAYDTIEGADVFTDGGEDPINALMNTYINGTAAMATTAMVNQTKAHGSSSATQKGMKQAINNMNLGSLLYRMGPDEMEGASEREKAHLEAYKRRRQELVTKLNARRKAKGKAAIFENEAGASSFVL